VSFFTAAGRKAVKKQFSYEKGVFTSILYNLIDMKKPFLKTILGFSY
jgi:hypothetical protein